MKEFPVGLFHDSFVLIRPGHDGVIGDILDIIKKYGLIISSVEQTKITTQQAQEIYAQYQDKPFFDPLVNLTAGFAHLIRVHCTSDAITVVRKRVIPDIRERYRVEDSRGANKLQDCAHAPDSPNAYIREAEILNLV